MIIENDAGATSSSDAGDGGDETHAPNGAIIEDAEAAPELSAGDLHAELRKASRDAIDVERGKAPKVAEKPVAEGKPVDEEPDAKGIARILKQREKVNGEREEARKLRDEAAADRAEAKREREALAKDREETAAFLKKLRENPAEAIKSAGWDPDDLVLGLSKGDTPETRAQRKTMTLEEELKSLKARLEERESREKADADKRQREHEERLAEQGKAGFLKTALDAEKYPTIAKMYAKRPHLLVAEAERVADAYYAATKSASRDGKGSYATWHEIAEYLEADHSDATEQSSQATGLRGASQAERAPGMRTVTTQRGSERRSAPKLSWDDMTPEQRKQAQLEDMRAAQGKR